ncbi:MAG: hypothetical protein WCC84_08160 [Candidatus Cybelea sp.]
MTDGLGSSNTFRLYVHRDGGKFIGLCTELRAVIEGSTTDEIVVKAKALIDSVTNRVKTRKPQITVRVSPSLPKATHL